MARGQKFDTPFFAWIGKELVLGKKEEFNIPDAWPRSEPSLAGIEANPRSGRHSSSSLEFLARFRTCLHSAVLISLGGERS